MDTIEVVNAIRDGNRIAAVDKIADLLYGKAAQAMNDYKHIVAKSFLNLPKRKLSSNHQKRKRINETNH